MKREYYIAFILILELVVTFQLSSRTVSILQTDSRIQNTRLQRDILKKEYISRSSTYRYVSTDLYVEEIAQAKLRYGYPDQSLYIIREDRLARPTLPTISLERNTASEQWGEMLDWIKLFFN